MLHQNDRPKPICSNNVSWLRPWLPFKIAGLVFVLVSLACGGSPKGAVIVKHLPTLTRTPLPTLTPTPNATQVAIALAAEVVAADNVQNPVPPEAAAAESEVMVAEIVSNAESIIAEDAPTNLEASNASFSAESVDLTGTNPNAPAPAEDVSVDSSSTESIDTASANLNASTPAEEVPTAVPPGPTATATVIEIASTPTETIPPTETAIPTETPTPMPTSTATPQLEGWVFSEKQFYPEIYISGVVISGNVMNDTGGPQHINEINTILYDNQGQVIPYQEVFFNRLPFQEMAQGEQAPFEVAIPDVEGVADVDFEVP
ncbi:MAG: hypothetical protein KDJ65_35690 [Anaerolineae bacterium]|nr:hypothetical protein [Anaerolineae bacterium]